VRIVDALGVDFPALICIALASSPKSEAMSRPLRGGIVVFVPFFLLWWCLCWWWEEWEKLLFGRILEEVSLLLPAVLAGLAYGESRSAFWNLEKSSASHSDSGKKYFMKTQQTTDQSQATPDEQLLTCFVQTFKTICCRPLNSLRQSACKSTWNFSYSPRSPKRWLLDSSVTFLPPITEK